MPLEVVVELQIRAISCPGVFLPDKEGVYLGVYLLNQYLETDCFPSVFPIAIQQSMRFEKVFESAVDPGAVAELLESFLTRFELIQLVSPDWEELAYYEENTRDFLYPEPKLTPSHPGMHRDLLMKTAVGFPGIAPKLEFSTRTAIRECVFPHRNRFFPCSLPLAPTNRTAGKTKRKLAESLLRGPRAEEEKCKSQKPLLTSHGQRVPLNNRKMKPKDKNPDRLPKGTPSRVPSPLLNCGFFQHQPTQLNLDSNFRFPWERKPPFVVRHVDSEKPFGKNNLEEHHSQKSRRQSKFLNLAFSMRRASSLDSLAANIKVIREPDERIILRSQSPSPLDSSQFGKSSPRHQGDADFHQEASFVTSQNFRSPSPLDQPLLRERFHPRSQSTWKKIHERDDFISEANYICKRPSYPLKKHPLHEQRYF
ncbi:spermatogenesis associated 6-like protein isoform X2 [Nannospalax galili]|uniref:spermatogenesis associated 6-like protein isoform X2 n=1 Tax=Nannospalax galili TaxID=1026970 RepID=UPI00111C41BE|nr:spermatogenesis associated 6-like protein isoform X2 [Nannospalax galili]